METLQRTANRGSVSTGYDVDNSIMFTTTGNYADSGSYFYDVIASSEGWAANSDAGTNARKCTVSTWVKRTRLIEGSHYPRIFSYRAGGIAFDCFFDVTNNQLTMYDDNTSMSLKTNRVFMDTSAWYHIVVAVDQTQSTAANRVKVYINGVQETSWATEDYGNQNVDLSAFRAAGTNVYVGGAANDAAAYFNGYISEYHFIDGAQLAQTDFGEFDSDTGIWIPKKFTGSYGTLGHYYNFTVASDMGKDFSGNGNDCNNRGDGITNGAARQATDTCTNNFCTLALQVRAGTQNHVSPSASGGTMIPMSGVNQFDAFFGTIGVTQGKWFWEFYVPSRSASYGLLNYVGLHNLKTIPASANAVGGTSQCYWIMHYGDYNATTNGSNTGQNTAAGLPSEGTGAVGRTFGVAFNADDGQITFYNNGSVTGNAGIDIFDLHDDMANDDFTLPSFTVYDNNLNVNFGGYSSVAITSGNTDANGYGNFEYAVPSGYYALCTKNLVEFG